MNNFFEKNKVFIIGLLSAIAVVIQQFATQPTIDWKTIGVAVGVAALAYVSNQWRGQGVTILGIIGTMAYVFVQNFNGGHINWNQVILLSILSLLTAVAPPAKSAAYEKSPVIEAAKDGGAAASIGINNNTDTPDKTQRPAIPITKKTP